MDPSFSSDGESWSTFVLQNVVPAFGGVISVLMYGATLRTVLEARRAHSIRELSPHPFPVLAANSAGWMAYACATRDPYVLAPNVIGFLLGIFYTVSVASLVAPRVRDQMLTSSLILAGVLVCLAGASSLLRFDEAQARAAWGWAANAILVGYYASPLSTVAKVLQTRSSGSLHPGMVAMNLVNGALWTSYGLAVADPFIWAINGLGAAISVSLFVLTLIFPARGLEGPSSPISPGLLVTQGSGGTSSERMRLVDGESNGAHAA